MTIRKLLVITPLFFLPIHAQQPPPAIRHPAQVTFRVLTDSGEPASNVEVTTSTFLRWEPGQGFGQDIYEENIGITNPEGIVTISFTSERGDCRYGIHDMPGYYSTRNLLYRFKEVQSDRWEPWNPIIDVVLKPILNPIPMYAQRVGMVTNLLELPQLNQPIGYDLVLADWVAPYGKGVSSDIIFTLKDTVPVIDPQDAFDYTLTVSFSNQGDGLQSVYADQFKGSTLHLPRFAPPDGYEAPLVKRTYRTARGAPLITGTRDDQNYLFRVRTILDKTGNIKSALYGKILGDITFGVMNSSKGYIKFSYCLNPTPLDRNLEFDPKQNLFKNLPSYEKVNSP